jgi:hypothetical protein
MALDRRSLERAPSPAPPPPCALAHAGFRIGRASASSSDFARSPTPVSDAHISRQELAAVAVALLLPIPLLVASGMRIPLPGAIERGVASLTPGVVFDAAVVEAEPARTPGEPAVASRAAGEETASADDSHAVSSATVEPNAGVTSARHGESDEPTPETNPPSPPSPRTDDKTPPGKNDSDPAGDISEPTAAEPVGSANVETGVTIEAEAATASVQIAVTDSGVAVDTGGDADVGPPLEIPLAPPTLPLP